MVLHYIYQNKQYNKDMIKSYGLQQVNMLNKWVEWIFFLFNQMKIINYNL